MACSNFLLHRIHNEVFATLPYTELDKMAIRVIIHRKEMMKEPKYLGGPPLYKDKERELTLYKTPINMLLRLSQVESPRAKRNLINEATKLAFDSLALLKDTDAHDYDFIISLLFYYASNRMAKTQQREKMYQYRLFSQLLYIYLFDRPQVEEE